MKAQAFLLLVFALCGVLGKLKVPTRNQSPLTTLTVHDDELLEASEEAEQGITAEQAFTKFDRDGNGFISTSELVEQLHGSGEMLMEVDVDAMDEMISQVDVDGDGQVSFEEFLHVDDNIEEDKRPARGSGRRPGRGSGRRPGRGSGRRPGRGSGRRPARGSGRKAQPRLLEDTEQAFTELDRDGDGFISTSELVEFHGGSGEMLMEVDVDEIDAMISQVDVDGDGHVSFEEFLHVDDNIDHQQAFTELDRDGNGFISTSELVEFHGGSGEMLMEVDVDEMDAMINQVDVDGDGQVSFEEFLHVDDIEEDRKAERGSGRKL